MRRLEGSRDQGERKRLVLQKDSLLKLKQFTIRLLEVESCIAMPDTDEIEILSAKPTTPKTKTVQDRRESVLKYLLLNPAVGRLPGKE